VRQYNGLDINTLQTRSTYIVQSNRRSKSIHKPSAPRRQLENSHTFGTHIIRQHFARVDRLHRSERQSEHRAEDVDKSDRSDGRLPAASLHEVGRRSSCDCQADCHPDCRAHEHFAAADDVVEAGADDCWDPAADGVDDVQEELGVRICYSDEGDEAW
jgi:hypothetical protein